MKQLQIWAIVLLHAISVSSIQFPDDGGRRQEPQQRSIDTVEQYRVHSYHNVNDLFGFGTRHPKRRRKPYRKNPCLPLPYSHQGRQSRDYQDDVPDENVNSKFLGLNLFLTDVDVDGSTLYNPFGGYPCSPGLFGSDSGHRPQKPHRPRPPKPIKPEKPDKPVIEDYDDVIIDDVATSDNPVRPTRPGSGGGPLGFFGEGGLFDLSSTLNRPGSLFNTISNLGSRPALTGGNVLGDSVENLQKPLIEINVPDALNGLRTGNWNARKIFGDVLDSFSSLTSLIFGNS